MNNESPKYTSDELISQRVNHLLFIHKITRRRAADELGISSSAFNTKINGGSSWRADELVSLTDRFGVSFDFLVGRQPIEMAMPQEEDEEESAPFGDAPNDLKPRAGTRQSGLIHQPHTDPSES